MLTRKEQNWRSSGAPSRFKRCFIDSKSKDVFPAVEKHASQSNLGDSTLIRFRHRARPFLLLVLAMAIIGWWISSITLKATRNRWVVQTFLAWTFVVIIAFRYLPTTMLVRPISAIWKRCVMRLWFKIPYRLRLAAGWMCLLAIIFVSAFGLPLQPVGAIPRNTLEVLNSNLLQGTEYSDRAISVSGLVVFQFCLWLTSSERKQVPWPTIVIGLLLQQVIAVIVLKTGVGLAFFNWVANLTGEFLNQANAGSTFFVDAETINGKHWFFVNTLTSIIFVVAFIQLIHYFGIMQWFLKYFAWIFSETMNISKAEAVVAAASPWIGLGESACLVRPYLDLMTESELHLVMTSGFSTIASSVLTAYINLGVPPKNLITSSVMSIPASISISKMRIPETEVPTTQGHFAVDLANDTLKTLNALHALSQGAAFGIIVAGRVLANVLTVLTLLSAVNGFLTWFGRGFGIHHLTLELILRYVFYPITFLLGVPRSEILRVAELFATKLIANEFAAYVSLHDIQNSSNPLSPRAYTIASYGLCGFANLGFVAQIGVLSALAPSRSRVIARIALSAMICGFISTLQTAGIVGMMV